MSAESSPIILRQRKIMGRWPIKDQGSDPNAALGFSTAKEENRCKPSREPRRRVRALRGRSRFLTPKSEGPQETTPRPFANSRLRIILPQTAIIFKPPLCEIQLPNPASL